MLQAMSSAPSAGPPTAESWFMLERHFIAFSKTCAGTSVGKIAVLAGCNSVIDAASSSSSRYMSSSAPWCAETHANPSEHPATPHRHTAMSRRRSKRSAR